MENVKQVRDNKDLAVLQAKGIRAILFPFNSKADAPLKDKRVRQAINLGDRPRDDRPGRPPGLRRGPHRALRAGQYGYNAEAAKILAYNPEKAKALLREAGYPNGIDITWNLCRGCWLKDTEVARGGGQPAQGGRRPREDQPDRGQPAAGEPESPANFQIGMIRWSRTYDPDTTVAGLRAQSTIQKWYAQRGGRPTDREGPRDARSGRAREGVPGPLPGAGGGSRRTSTSTPRIRSGPSGPRTT